MPRTSSRQLVEQAQLAMRRDLSRPVTIASLAHELCVSQTTLKEAFRACTGMPVYRWYRRLRIESAAQMLLEDGCTVGEAASRVGYANPSKFSSAFCAVMGKPPMRWLSERERRGMAVREADRDAAMTAS